jgi:hypothetical protein
MGVFEQRLRNVLLSVDNAGLAQVTRIGTQYRHFTHCQAGCQHKAVEVVVVDLAAESSEKCVFKLLAVLGEVNRHAVLNGKLHVVQHDMAVFVILDDADVECAFADDAEAKVFQQRHAA